MTREEAINTLGNFKRYISGGGVTDRKANKAIDMAIEALQTEAVQDEAVKIGVLAILERVSKPDREEKAMTKQEILGYLDDVLHPIVSPDNWYVYSDLYDMIEELPFEEPVWHGKWEMKPDPFFDDIPVCSECGCTTKMREKTKYCPNCGAKMDKGGAV